MVRIVEVRYPDGHKGIYTIHDEFDERRIMREIQERGGVIVPEKPPSPDAVLREKYGVGLKEIQQIINSSKSQPEAIQKLRKMLTGSTKYDPRYHELEVLLTSAWDAKTHPYIPEAGKEYKEELRSVVLRNTKGFYSDGKRILPIHHVVGPVPRPEQVLEIERNTGIKTVPMPEPVPTLIATRVPTNAEPHTVHVTNVQEQEPKKIDFKKVGLAIAALAVLYYVLRR